MQNMVPGLFAHPYISSTSYTFWEIKPQGSHLVTSHLVLNICTCMLLCVYLNTNGRASFQSLAYVEAATFILALHTYVVKTPIPHSCALFVYKVPGEWSVQHLSFISVHILVNRLSFIYSGWSAVLFANWFSFKRGQWSVLVSRTPLP